MSFLVPIGLAVNAQPNLTTYRGQAGFLAKPTLIRRSRLLTDAQRKLAAAVLTLVVHRRRLRFGSPRAFYPLLCECCAAS
jgi:hypothetical protein